MPILPVLPVLMSMFAGDAQTVALQPAVDAEVAARMPALLDAYHDLHKNPELSLQEKESAKKLADRLRALGFVVTEGVGVTGVVGVLENGAGPTVLIRADLDALPVAEETGLDYASKATAKTREGRDTSVMHACGHDVHQTVLFGTCGVLSKLRDSWHGAVIAIGQPAEETGEGARLMIEAGLFERFKKPDACIALHVAPDVATGQVGVTSGFALANVDSIDITIHGRGGHGSRPESAVDPIVMSAQVITALQTIVSRRVDPQDAAVVTVGSIHSGTKHNIIPNVAELQLTVRTYSDATRKLVIDSIRSITVETCRALGAEQDPDVRVRDGEFTPATYNDPALAERAKKVFVTALGADAVVDKKPVMGGEDFSRFSKEGGMPGFMFWLGSVPQARIDAAKNGGEPLPTTHSSKYYPDPAPTISTGVRAMSALALDLLGRP